MLSGFYAGASGLLYNEQRQAVTASNLANVDTAAFRRSMLVLRSRQHEGKHIHVDRDVRDRHPSFYGIQKNGVYKVYQETGRLKSTDNPLDIAIPSQLKNAFFKVKKADPNDSSTYYTRNGALSLGLLDPKNSESPTVLYLGGNVAIDHSGQPLEVNPAGGQFRVEESGLVRQGNTIIGELPVYRFNKTNNPGLIENANLQYLEQFGDSLYGVAAHGRDKMFPMRLEVGKNGVQKLVKQGVREESNVNPVNELVYMMESSRSFNSNVTAMKTQSEGLTKLFQIIRS
jgi:flagellar basal-body rod protein FlgG